MTALSVMNPFSNSARCFAIVPVLLLGFCGCVSSPNADGKLSKAAKLHDRAITFHERRCLSVASTFYRHVLALDQPKEPSVAQVAAVMKFAPRLYTTPNEFFPLADVAAVIHPDKPLIGYHLFWG